VTGAPLHLILTGAQRRAILDDCEARLPIEACGLLVGIDEPAGLRVAEILPAPNVEAAPDRFEIDPHLLFATHRRLRAEPDLRLLGHYHSHPGGPARPSATDRARAYEAGAVWLVVAQPLVPNGQAELGAFLFDDPEFRELAILVDG
jgi:proteasome lid subunit RPN8/RPN11